MTHSFIRLVIKLAFSHTNLGHLGIRYSHDKPSKSCISYQHSKASLNPSSYYGKCNGCCVPRMRVGFLGGGKYTSTKRSDSKQPRHQRHSTSMIANKLTI